MANSGKKPSLLKRLTKLPKKVLLLLCSLLPFLPGYVCEVAAALVLRVPGLALAFYLAQFVTLLLWGALSWALCQRGEAVAGHMAFLHLVPAVLLMLLVVQELTGYWFYVTELLPKLYFAALATPGFLISSAILPETAWLGYVFAFLLMAGAALLGCLLKRRTLRGRSTGTK